jgi:hypothetical protein
VDKLVENPASIFKSSFTISEDFEEANRACGKASKNFLKKNFLRRKK